MRETASKNALKIALLENAEVDMAEKATSARLQELQEMQEDLSQFQSLLPGWRRTVKLKLLQS